MNEHDAREAVSQTLRRIAPEIDLDASATSEPMAVELDLDSMDLLSLLTGLAERTGVEIPDGALSSSSSVDDVVAYLVAH